MTIEQITTERDRLRAALEANRDRSNKVFQMGDAEARRALQDIHATAHEALANTSPAPGESVNKELLEALIHARKCLAREIGVPVNECIGADFIQINAAIAKAEKAGGTKVPDGWCKCGNPSGIMDPMTNGRGGMDGVCRDCGDLLSTG